MSDVLWIENEDIIGRRGTKLFSFTWSFYIVPVLGGVYVDFKIVYWIEGGEKQDICSHRGAPVRRERIKGLSTGLL